MSRKRQPLADAPDFIRPIEEAAGPLNPLRDLLERHRVDDVVRAINAGLEVFDAGFILMTREGSLNIIKDILIAKDRRPAMETA
jgi:hypothetical protein